MRHRLTTFGDRIRRLRPRVAAGVGERIRQRFRRRARTEARPEPGLPDTSLGKITVSYEPQRDGDPDPGEVVWAWVHYEESLTEGKDRPVIIIGRQGETLAAVQLTTKSDDDPGNVFVGPGPWDDQGRPSWAKVRRIVRIDPATVRRTDFVVARDRFDAVAAALSNR